MSSSIPTTRSLWLDRLFPRGVPGLWCNLLVHVTDDDKPDLPRTIAHLRWLREHAQVFALSNHSIFRESPWGDDDWQSLLQAVLHELNAGRESLLLHVAGEHHLHATTDWLTNESHRQPYAAMIAHGVCGLALSMNDTALPHALALGWPVGIEHPPFPDADDDAIDRLAAWAGNYENCLYFIETADNDMIARSGRLPAGVFRLRAAVGRYTSSLASTGGLYHGLMPQWASVFPSLFSELLLAPALGQWDESHALTARLQTLHEELTAITQNDLVMALGLAGDLQAMGPSARQASPLHAAIAAVLARHDLLPQAGYLR